MKIGDSFSWKNNSCNASGPDMLRYIGLVGLTKVDYVSGTGIRLTHRGASIIALFRMLVEPSFKDYYKIGPMMLNHVRRVDGKIVHDVETSPTPLILLEDFKPLEDEFAYKYFESSCIKYFREGSFRLGTLRYYREIENSRIADDSEGIAILKINTSGEPLTHCSGYISGFHYYIFCMSVAKPQSKRTILKENFGERAMKIRIKPFAEAIKRHIGAVRYVVFKVIYNDSKVFQLNVKDAPPELFDPDKQEIQNTLTYTLNRLRGIGSYPHLFVKPFRFCPEEEVRISFEMERDIENLYLDIELPNLLKHVEFLEAEIS
jgi:hypothetical protein